MRRSLLFVATAAVACFSAIGCGDAATASGHELTVLAAASLTLPVEAASEAYESAHPGVRVRLSFDSSAALRTQIEQGAPADLFLSADATNPQRLAEAGRGGRPRAFASNELVVIVPAAGRSPVRTPLDLAAEGVSVIAAGAKVPITVYAAELVGRLAELPGYPTDFVVRYEANIVSREDNVKAAVAKVELGEGDAAIVYRTDAEASKKVSPIEVPDAAQVTATYAGIVLADAASADEAGLFLEWLVGPEGQAILAEAGFGPPP